MRTLEGKRVYVIEDDATNMAVVAVTLKRSGALVVQDFWNADILTNIRYKMPVDVILLDLMLRHDMNGYSVFEELQKDPELSKIPVIAVSAADPDIEIPRARIKGLNGFIGKPIVPRLFAPQIASVIAGEKVWFAHNDHYYMEK